MIDPAKSLTEQLLNLSEVIGTELGKLAATIVGKADKQHTHVSADVTDLAETYATKEDLKNSSAGADATQMCEQLIVFYNGYKGESLDYRDYLDNSSGELLEALYAFGDGYKGETNGATA